MGHVGQVGLAIAGQPEREVNEARTGHGVGQIGDKVFMKAVVAAVGKQRGDTFALGIKARHVELHAGVDKALGGVLRGQDAGNAGVLDVVVDVMNEIGLAGLQQIGEVELLAMPLLQDEDAGIEEALVAQLLRQVVLRAAGQVLVIDDGGFAHGLQRAIDPKGGIAAREGIGGQGQLEQREPALVGRLAHIGTQRKSVQVAILSFDAHLHLIQKELIFGHVFRAGT